MPRIRHIGEERRTSPASRDASPYRVCVVWAPRRENFTYHYVDGPRHAARYLALPGPTEGAMAAIFQEWVHGEWTDWYHPQVGIDIEECIEEGIELPEDPQRV